MKTVLITGAARGLGKHLSELLVSKGYFVYGTSRNLKTLKNVENTEFFYLDLTDQKSIDELANHFLETGITIDAIVHNSGVAYLDPIEVLDEEEYRHIFEVNFFGVVKLTKKLLPILKKSAKSNLVFISSIVSIDCWPYLGAYSASKRALESVAFEWATLLKKWNIYVSVVQPNPLPTDMQILRSKNAGKSLYPELESRKLDWESISDTTNLVHKILENPNSQFFYQTGEKSKKVVNHFIRQEAYQKSLETYQKQFLKDN